MTVPGKSVCLRRRPGVPDGFKIESTVDVTPLTTSATVGKRLRDYLLLSGIAISQGGQKLQKSGPGNGVVELLIARSGHDFV
jgi:hypothetical protein